MRAPTCICDMLDTVPHYSYTLPHLLFKFSTCYWLWHSAKVLWLSQYWLDSKGLVPHRRIGIFLFTVSTEVLKKCRNMAKERNNNENCKQTDPLFPPCFSISLNADLYHLKISKIWDLLLREILIKLLQSFMWTGTYSTIVQNSKPFVNLSTNHRYQISGSI
jgi:hypothetical protein